MSILWHRFCSYEILVYIVTCYLKYHSTIKRMIIILQIEHYFMKIRRNCSIHWEDQINNGYDPLTQ